MTQPVTTALAKKVSASQDERGGQTNSILRALRLALARTAADRLQLPLSVIAARRASRSADGLAGFAGDNWLLLHLLNNEGLSAAVCMDLETVSAIVQVQTIGEVTSTTPTPRAFTDTDAAMVAPMIEDACTRAARLVETVSEQASLTGYQYKLRLPDLRALSLAMTQDAYVSYDLTVELGGGLRQGRISVLLPEEEGPADAEPSGDSRPHIEQASGVLRAELNTVICQMALPLASFSALAAGDVLPLTGARLDRAQLLTIDRTRTAVGRLGQSGGMRAIRLNEYEPQDVPSQAETQDFLEARTSVIQTSAELSVEPIHTDTHAIDTIDSKLQFGDSDQIAAEISKLAGLNDDAGQVT
ncbi:FliM/FliN family flagellar motor C-terminal domain-containing protein [Ruegeria sp. HKCCA5491]|uniref:FliM/FliN family flagellar motor C-terminal domain-containing protein n=1 Tax=Ruegeria sp. HKCCA5491 TaxID=2682986 RepID=UPI001488D60A|nr:FliM/FliN family flagellar motor C-terminal domain-containing protein [Ruegeria sp. HKCCA5491]